MTRVDRYALDAAKEIVIACMSNIQVRPVNAESGKLIGEFYEAIYQKIRELNTIDND